MRIGLDLHTVNNFMQGSRTYIYNLAKALLRNDPANEYVLYLPHAYRSVIEEELQGFNAAFKEVPKGNRIIRLSVTFPARLAFDHIDIFHCNYIGLVIRPCPYIVTLHDILHEVYPEFYPKMLKTLMSLTYPISAKRAAFVLTVSHFSKKEIIRLYNIPEEKIEVTPDAVSSEFRIIEDREKIRQVAIKYKIRGNYILFLGRIEPRKNLQALIEAYHVLKTQYKIRHQLVVAGMQDPLFKDFCNNLIMREMSTGILFTGGVPQEDLPYLINGADLFAYPSFAEGFGLPVLEAMSCGTPVVASNTTSLPEVTGGAAVLIDPNNIRELAEALNGVLNNSELRNEMREKGLDQARRFSWDKTAEKTLRIYEKIFSGS